MGLFKRFKSGDKGQGLVEYGLILALISVVAVSALGGVGNRVSGSFDKVMWEEYLATDEEFSGNTDGEFKYIGNKEIVYIPHTIKGVEVSSYRYMFREVNDNNVKKVISDNPNITDMMGMFYKSSASHLDLSEFDTRNVTDMSWMFYGSSATSLDLSTFDTRSVTKIISMFHSSSAISLDLSSFDTHLVKSMQSMFNGASATTLDLRSFDTRLVTNMYAMFHNSNATHLDLSSFDTGSVTSMFAMFWNSSTKSLDLSSFDTRSVTDMNGMFYLSDATSGYARSVDDADRLNSSSQKPSKLMFTVR